LLIGVSVGLPLAVSYTFYKIFVENIFVAEEDFVDRDATVYSENISEIGEQAPGHSPPWLLRLQNHLMKTRFGKWMLLKIPYKLGKANLVRYSALSCRATFYPIGYVAPRDIVTGMDLTRFLRSTSGTGGFRRGIAVFEIKFSYGYSFPISRKIH
jgi:hypothetical protein